MPTYKDPEKNREYSRNWARNKRLNNAKFREEQNAAQRLRRLQEAPNQERLMIQRNNRLRLNPRGKQQCLHCHEVKPLDAYHFTPSTACKNGLYATCRECSNRQQREIYRPRYLARKKAQL